MEPCRGRSKPPVLEDYVDLDCVSDGTFELDYSYGAIARRY